MSQIGDVENSFGLWLGKGTVSQYFKAINRYRDGFDDAFLLKCLPIVPDTNVLLNHMHISEDLATRTRRFLEGNADRVILPRQVQLEYERHKPDAPLLDDSGFMRLPPQGEADMEFLKKEFDALAARVDLTRIKAELAKPYTAIPGLADLKKKPDRPHGDYYILHEMMAYARTNTTDLIFLTRDVDKGDWLTATRRAYPHMIDTVYLATGQCIFILEAPLALAATLDDLPAVIPKPFTDFEAYRARFMVMWERLKGLNAAKSHDVDSETRKCLSELRRVRNVLVQNVRVSDGFLDRKWLLMMEEMLAGQRLVSEPTTSR